MSDFQAKNVLV